MSSVLQDPCIASEGFREKPELRVLHVLSNLGIGGAELWVVALLQHYKEASGRLPVRIKMDLFLTRGTSSVLDEKAQMLGAELFYSCFSRGSLVPFCRDWRRTLHKGHYHAIHDHQEFSAGIHFLMGTGRLPRVRIAHLHNSLTHRHSYSSSPLRRATVVLGERAVASLGTHILSTSDQLLRDQGFFHRRYARLHREAIYCGFDTSRFAGSHQEHFDSLCEEFGFPTNSRIMLFVGRLDSNRDDRLNEKNPLFAMETAKLCAERDPRFRFLMAGGGEDVRQRLQIQVQAWRLADRLRLIDYREDVPRLMLGSHLFLLPSIAEGLGMVAVEAQAAGLPVVASTAVPRECAVIPEMVHFLDLKEGLDAWATFVLRVMCRTRPPVRPANTQIQHSRFSIDSSATRLLEIYQNSKLPPHGGGA